MLVGIQEFLENSKHLHAKLWLSQLSAIQVKAQQLDVSSMINEIVENLEKE